MGRNGAHPRRRDAAVSGVAAIEFALVFPMLMLLFFGMVNLTHYIVEIRKISLGAKLMTDLVTRSTDTITASTIDDYFKAVKLSFWPMPTATADASIGIDVYGYRWTAPTATINWKRFSKSTASCTPPVIGAGSSIETALSESDIVISVVCADYTAPAANYPGFGFLKDIKIERMFLQRPRETTSLNCTGCS